MKEEDIEKQKEFKELLQQPEYGDTLEIHDEREDLYWSKEKEINPTYWR